MFLRVAKSLQRLTHMPRATLFKFDNIDESMTVDMLLSEKIRPRKRTKTVCTIGYNLFNEAQQLRIRTQ